MTENKPTSQERRRVLIALLLAGIGMVMVVWWGIWAFMHNETGVLIVTSRPPGAEVILNRRPTNLLTSAFISGLPADSFIVSLRMDGYRPIPPLQGVSIQPNETTRTTFIMSPIARGDHRDLPTVTGLPQNWQWKIVRISSVPDSASLVVDNKAINVHTPVTLLLEEGLHHLQAVWADGSKSYKNVLIDPGQSQPAITLRPVTYEKNPSSIDRGGVSYSHKDKIAVPGVSEVTVATSEAACELMRTAYRDKDERTLSGLILSGSMFSAENFCDVKVLERKANSVKVRIMSGRQSGEIGWVPIGFLD